MDCFVELLALNTTPTTPHKDGAVTKHKEYGSVFAPSRLRGRHDEATMVFGNREYVVINKTSKLNHNNFTRI